MKCWTVRSKKKPLTGWWSGKVSEAFKEPLKHHLHKQIQTGFYKKRGKKMFST